MKKAISILLAAIMIFSLCVTAFADDASAGSSYTIVNPYADVIWSGDGAYRAYKGNLHTHSTVSDASTEYREMITEYYNRGFDFLAMTDHAVTGKPWNERPTQIPLYLYQYIAGHKMTYFTDEEFAALQDGSFPVNGQPRGYGMTYVPGGNELNGLTITKDHVNALFLPEHAGDNYLGFENDYEGAVRLADKNGAISFINHPGDWLNSNADRANCSDPEKIAYFSDILLRYDSCIGMEVFNEHNGVTGYDRDTWDNILMYCLPYGKNIIAFSNSDAHTVNEIDSSFEVFMMKENTLDNIKQTMLDGAFFAITRVIRADKEKFGPEESFDARNTDIAYPMFSDIQVDGHKITVSFHDAYNLKWVANGNVIKSEDYTQSADTSTFTIDLDEIDGAEDFLYVRCQLLGTGGLTLTQTFVIDDGTEPPVYERDNSASAVLKRLVRQFFSLRIFVLLKKLWSVIFD